MEEFYVAAPQDVRPPNYAESSFLECTVEKPNSREKR
jgi:hypothetical protein